MKKTLISLLEIVEVGLISLVIITVIRTVLVQPFLVNGASMEPGFSSGDYLLVDELTYRFRSPERGEVIVFRYPNDESVFYIKRIVGLPGERITVSSGVVTVFNDKYPDGVVINEPYILDESTRGQDIDLTLNDGTYVVLGDNRQYSYDSRSWGSLDREEIVGLVRLRLWPLNKVQAFEHQQYSGELRMEVESPSAK